MAADGSMIIGITCKQKYEKYEMYEKYYKHDIIIVISTELSLPDLINKLEKDRSRDDVTGLAKLVSYRMLDDTC